jgi:hypothetical protein
MHYKKVLKQILSLYINVADPAINYILSGLLPIEAEIHIKALTFFGSITRSEDTSIEWRLAERQLQVRDGSFNLKGGICFFFFF